MDKTPFVAADYKTPELPEYAGNPLIEALPSIWTRPEAIRRLALRPPVREADRLQPEEIRLQMLERIRALFVPLPMHIRLYNKFATMIRSGYVARNFALPKAWVSLERKINSVADGSFPEVEPQVLAHGMSITGVSGVGKSTAIRKILKGYPQVIEHSMYRGNEYSETQLVWLILECPGRASLKSLCLEFLDAMDRALKFKSNYQQKYGGKHRSTDYLVLTMARLAALHHLGVLVVDEIQNLSTGKSGGADVVLNHFVQLRNKLGVPVVLVGTPEAEPILGGRLRQARRGTGHGDVRWDRMDESQLPWELFVKDLWRYQYTRDPIPMTPELLHTLYWESQGIADLAKKLWIFSQYRAIDDGAITGSELVTPETIRLEARESLSGCQPILDAIRSGVVKSLGTATDIYWPEPLKAGNSHKVCRENLADAAGYKEEAGPRPDLKEPGETAQRRRNGKKSARHTKQASTSNIVEWSGVSDANLTLMDVVKRGRENAVAAYESLHASGQIRLGIGDL